ncbi:MAG: hypothetical protein ACPGQD_01820 [Planctomycetota bacterium]
MEALALVAVPLADEAGWELRSPAVGLVGELHEAGALTQPGHQVAELRILGRRVSLLVPPGVVGHLAALDSGPGTRRLEAVAYGTPLLQVLKVVAGEDARFLAAAEEAAADEDGLALRAPQAGRFYRSPEPGAAPFVAAGEALEGGRTIGLIEVMKTFSPVKYQAGNGLPARAAAGDWLVEDGAEVEEGTPLLALDASAGG